MDTCKHCGEQIKHFYGRLWHAHEGKPPFPQYCRTQYDAKGEPLPGVLHEPSL